MMIIKGEASYTNPITQSPLITIVKASAEKFALTEISFWASMRSVLFQTEHCEGGSARGTLQSIDLKALIQIGDNFIPIFYYLHCSYLHSN